MQGEADGYDHAAALRQLVEQGLRSEVGARHFAGAAGQRQVHVDSESPEVVALRRSSAKLLKIRVSEEVSLAALQAGAVAETIRVVEKQSGALVPISLVLPDFDEAANAGRRAYKIKVANPPDGETQVRLEIDTSALVDLFGNTAVAVYESPYFNWAAQGTQEDKDNPTIERVSLHPCATSTSGSARVRVELSETGSTTKANTQITVDGANTTWSRHPAGSAYGLISACLSLPSGSHSFDIATGPLDTSGKGLASAFQLTLPVADPQLDQHVYTAPDPGLVATSTTGTRIGFDGRPQDAVTGWYYFRNRWYDPELGRFVTTDPLGYVDGPSMYQFAGYDSVNMGDPMGLYEVDFHYYAVYYMSFLALGDADRAERVATASQFVDDYEPTKPGSVLAEDYVLNILQPFHFASISPQCLGIVSE